MIRLYEKYKDQGLTVIGISHDREGVKVVEPFVKKYSIPYPVLIGDLSIAISYIGVNREQPTFRIPYIILIDRQGNVVGQFEEGKNPEATNLELLEERIKKVLTDTPDSPRTRLLPPAG
jgi:peroxiredoxin